MNSAIGTDSQVKAGVTGFATVIVFLRKRKGGFMYIRSESTRQRMTIKERMLTEVRMSIDVAYELCNLFSRYRVDMEVHADINTNPSFKSNEALREAMQEEMRADERVYLMGEEVAEYNGAYKVSQGMLAEFGPKRVIDTPISELGFTAVGVGAEAVDQPVEFVQRT